MNLVHTIPRDERMDIVENTKLQYIYGIRIMSIKVQQMHTMIRVINNNIYFIYSSKRFIKRYDITSLKLIRNVKFVINIQFKIMLHAVR